MNVLIRDPKSANDLIATRRELGIDRYDEVWDGVYVMPPMANTEHQRIVSLLNSVFAEVTEGVGFSYPGGNVSDQEVSWERNYRCPDVFVILDGCKAVDRGSHFFGGPDFVVEVRSPGDDSYEKFPFYASIGVREVLVVERDRREPSLYRLGRTKLSPVKPTELDGVQQLVSQVLPLTFRGVVKKPHGPRLEVRRTVGRKKVWLV